MKVSRVVMMFLADELSSLEMVRDIVLYKTVSCPVAC